MIHNEVWYQITEQTQNPSHVVSQLGKANGRVTILGELHCIQQGNNTSRAVLCNKKSEIVDLRDNIQGQTGDHNICVYG